MIERAAWALLTLFVFTVPWEKTVFVPGIGTVSRLAGALAFAVGLFAAIRHHGTLRKANLALVVSAAFVLWSAATWFWSLDQSATLERTSTYVQLLAMTWLVWESTRTDSEQRQLMHAYVAGAGVASAATLIRYAQGQQTYWRRYAAAGFDPNDLGLTVALSIPMALYLAGRARGMDAWWYRSLVALTGFAILLTASRTALVVAVIGFGLSVFTWRQSDVSQRLSAVFLLAALILGAIWFAPKAARTRIATLPGELTRGTLHNRTTIWKAGVKAFRLHPFRGVGGGAFPDAVRPWIGVPGRAGHEYVAHNTFLSVLVETGPIGFGLFSLLLAVLGAFVWMLNSAERALWTTMLVVWATGAFTLTWEHRKPTWLLFALIMTAWIRAWRNENAACA